MSVGLKHFTFKPKCIESAGKTLKVAFFGGSEFASYFCLLKGSAVVNWLFRRHFWILHLVFVCIIAVIAAEIVTTLLGYRLSKSIPEKPLNLPSMEAEQEVTAKNFSLVNDRNLFAAKREQISLAEIEGNEQVNPGRWQDAQPTTLPLKLVSTMVFFDPFDSRTVIQNVSSGTSLVYSIGECEEYEKKYQPRNIETILPEQDWEPDRPCNSIDGIATVRRIEEFRVYIFNERDRKFEYLSLLGDEVMRGRERFAPEEIEEGEGVRKVGATSYEIDQKEFDKALSNVARLMTEARAVPEIDSGGNNIGFKIIYLKEGSLFEKIGIERMDVLTRINGYELNSPEKALQLFSKLKTANQFTIDLKRGDRSVTLDYSVVR